MIKDSVSKYQGTNFRDVYETEIRHFQKMEVGDKDFGGRLSLRNHSVSPNDPSK